MPYDSIDDLPEDQTDQYDGKQKRGTTERVLGGVLRIGVVEAPPFVQIDEQGEPHGPEPELARRLAERLNARVDWRPGPADDLMEALAAHRLDLVIGGLLETSPWASRVALTLPWTSGPARRVWAGPSGESRWIVTLGRFLQEYGGEVAPGPDVTAREEADAPGRELRAP